MKKRSDPRHQRRIQLMQQLFSWQANPHRAKTAASEIISKLKKIDSLIEKGAPAWPIKQINRIDLSILRLAVFELILNSTTPPKVVVDEAVELAKQYGAQSSPSFVNGVLGKLIEIKNIKVD